MNGLSFTNIRGSLEGGMCRFEIGDNGKGMSESVIRRLFEGESSSVGIRNTLNRIKLQYGDQADIQISSEPGKGAVIIILLPVNIQS